MQTMKSCLLPLLVAVVVLPKPAVLSRIRNTVDLQASTSSDESEDAFVSHAHGLEEKYAHNAFGSHSHGLEHEHTFTSGSVWSVTTEDEAILGQITDMVNADAEDGTEFTWENERASWTFGLVMLSEEDAQGSLALHMLHRHGLGPLMASHGGESFMRLFRGKLQANGNTTGVAKAKLLVEAIEEYEPVQALRQLMGTVTMSGLRNMHSYDHARSVREGAGKHTGCSQRTPGACVLQAAHSQKTHMFLRENGFDAATSKYLQSSAFDTLRHIFNPIGYVHLDSDTRKQFATAQNGGDVRIVSKVEFKGSSNWFAIVDVNWEGGVTHQLEIPVSKTMRQELESQGAEAHKMELMRGLVHEYIDAKLHDHRAYMKEHRLIMWGGEEGEFSDLYGNLPPPSIASKDAGSATLSPKA